jgi:hypothetical protein
MIEQFLNSSRTATEIIIIITIVTAFLQVPGTMWFGKPSHARSFMNVNLLYQRVGSEHCIHAVLLKAPESHVAGL